MICTEGLTRFRRRHPLVFVDRCYQTVRICSTQCLPRGWTSRRFSKCWLSRGQDSGWSSRTPEGPVSSCWLAQCGTQSWRVPSEQPGPALVPLKKSEFGSESWDRECGAGITLACVETLLEWCHSPLIAILFSYLIEFWQQEQGLSLQTQYFIYQSN